MKKKFFSKLMDFYMEQLVTDIIPYWLRHIDHEYGGVLNCLTNKGDKLVSDRKFVWSQGRWIWVTAHFYEQGKKWGENRLASECLKTARDTTNFLMKHARLENGNCSFVLSRTGEPVFLENASTEYDISILADYFAIYGVGEYARVTEDKYAYTWAKDLYLHCHQRLTSGTAKNNYPYPLPSGYICHGDRMIGLEVSQELARTADVFDDGKFASLLKENARKYQQEIMEIFVQKSGIVLEMMGSNLKPVNTILGRYINPGHTLESMWFVIHQAIYRSEPALIKSSAEISRITLQKSWDGVNGGIPQFLDMEGGAPKGEIPPELVSHIMVQKLQTLWDKKLWWPHSEALYNLLLIHAYTGESWALKEYEKVHEYTFSVFPNPDRSIGEWIQIRSRTGEPEEAVVALPVKDPMHIARAFMHCINVLERLRTS
jgi:N-acylglucosamine 2-epimerase